MVETYYRLHTAGPSAVGPLAFTADNAWSALWGTQFVDGDPSRAVCADCGGTGDDSATGGDGDGCRNCDGEGNVEVDRGYSCCGSAAELVEYMTAQGIVADDDHVVVFTGHEVGSGSDGEPLVVPTTVTRWMTWAGLVAEVSA